MNLILKAAAPLLAALLLTACGSKEPPQEYTVEEETIPSLTALVTLENVQFEETTGEDDAVTYVYSGLSNGGEIAKEYTQALESDQECTIATDSETTGAPDFTASSGQALAGKELEDSEQILLLTIQWEETSCSVTPSLADADAMPQEQADQSITLEQATARLEAMTPAQLGLSGSSMAEYLVYPQEGTVLLDDQPCLLMNVYSAADHKFQGSYLLTVPAMQIYALDRATGEASPIS